MDSPIISIQDLEKAINQCRETECSNESIVLGPLGRELANVYGIMIFDKVSEIRFLALTPNQQQAFRTSAKAAGLDFTG